ncbi:MAG TPA: ATP-binding protein [Phycisphaerales bacterium]|nr:ATP-binding protein [Phycisphaerales bacterium]
MQSPHLHAPIEGGGSFLARLFDVSDFTARVICFNRDPSVVWLHLVSDTIIAAAYFSIPVALITLVLKRRDLAFPWMFVLFGGFILLCGTTHVFNVLALHYPMYRFDGVVKALTAAFSIGTAVALWPLIPKILTIPSPDMLREANAKLEGQVAERRKAQEDLQRARDELQLRVDQLENANKELELSYQRLRVSERMAAIGTLSAGLGHDMGNLLLPVRARLESIESRGVPAELKEDVAAIRTCAEYLQRLSKGLRLLSLDPEEGEMEATPVRAWWDEVRPMLENAIPESVELQGDFGADLPPALLSRHGLTQAVFNLVQNAGDAMRARGHGRITVWARKGAETDTIDIGVRDNGPGMSEETRRRCLEPFFTTKTRAISTGLGLALVNGIIQRAKGTIEVRTQLGQGSEFILHLRAARSLRRSDAPPLRAVVSIPDARLRSFTSELLKSLGFEVVVSDAPADGSASVWVVDASTGSRDKVQEFVRGSDQRRALMLGGDGSDTDRVRIVREPRPTAVRAALDQAAHELGLR